MPNISELEHQAQLTGGVVFPALIGTAYGAIYLVGHWHEPKLLPAALIIGGVASVVLSQSTYWVSFLAHDGLSWRATIAHFGGLIPYIYSMLLMAYLGLWRLLLDVASYHGVWPLIGPLFWIMVGWRMLFVLGQMSRRSAAPPIK